MYLRVFAGVVGAVAAVLGGATAHAQTAATWYVSPSGTDASSCASVSAPCATIDGAIGKAASGDTVRVAVGTYTSSAAEVVLVDESVTLEGGWDAAFGDDVGISAIDGESARLGIRVAAGVSATVSRLEIRDATRGILNDGTLRIEATSIHDNSVGGVFTRGPLTMVGSTVSGNSANATMTAGGISVMDTTASITNSTIAGNTQPGGGGGIWLGEESYPDGERPSLSLTNVTITGNTSTAYWGAGVRVSTGTVEVANSIVYGNTSPWTEHQDFGLDGWNSGMPLGSVSSQGYNLGTGFTPAAGDIQTGDARLGSLSWDIGVTDTIPLLPGSPAIDAGNPAGCRDRNAVLLVADQRGVPRPHGGRCDIGAYEAQPPPNDQFASSVSFDGLPGALLWANRYATRETGEPQHGSDGGGASVWFSWTPTFTGTAFVSTAGSDVDTTVGVYTGSALPALLPVASNDDGTRAVSTSRACFPVTSGTPVRIAVDGYGASYGYADSVGDLALSWGQYTSTDPCAVVPPEISGQPTVGGTLSASAGTWVGTVAGLAYQWIACVPDSIACYLVDGATDSEYSPTADDAGWELGVVVAAKHPSDPALDGIGYSLTTAAVPAPPGDGGGGGGGGQPADLELSKSASVQTAAVGDTILYRLRARVKNFQQTSGASRVVVTDTLPAGVELVSTKVNRGPGCTGTTTLSCNLDFLSGQLVGEIEVLVRVTQAGTLVNTATVAAAQPDPDTANNTASATVTAPQRTPSGSAAPSAPAKGVSKRGTARADTLRGTRFADRLLGLAGNDRLLGLGGNDTLLAGSGNDVLSGGPGLDLLDAGPGNDTLQARDGKRDTLRCGPGKDAAVADRQDIAGRDCEIVRRR